MNRKILKLIDAGEFTIELASFNEHLPIHNKPPTYSLWLLRDGEPVHNQLDLGIFHGLTKSDVVEKARTVFLDRGWEKLAERLDKL